MTDVGKIEDQLYKTLAPAARQIKVAMLLARAFPDLDLPGDEIINNALDILAERHDIETFGDFHQWRRSEIRRFGPIKT
jgi:hypothetical protein